MKSREDGGKCIILAYVAVKITSLKNSPLAENIFYTFSTWKYHPHYPEGIIVLKIKIGLEVFLGMKGQ